MSYNIPESRDDYGIILMINMFYRALWGKDISLENGTRSGIFIALINLICSIPVSEWTLFFFARARLSFILPDRSTINLKGLDTKACTVARVFLYSVR